MPEDVELGEGSRVADGRVDRAESLEVVPGSVKICDSGLEAQFRRGLDPIQHFVEEGGCGSAGLKCVGWKVKKSVDVFIVFWLKNYFNLLSGKPHSHLKLSSTLNDS